MTDLTRGLRGAGARIEQDVVCAGVGAASCTRVFAGAHRHRARRPPMFVESAATLTLVGVGGVTPSPICRWCSWARAWGEHRPAAGAQARGGLGAGAFEDLRCQQPGPGFAGWSDHPYAALPPVQQATPTQRAAPAE